MVKTGHTNSFIPSVEIKNYNVMIDGKSFFDQPVRNNMRTYNNILKIMTGQGKLHNRLFTIFSLFG